MKNINIIKVFILLCTVSLFVSCDEGGDPDPGGTNVEAIAGDWWVIALEPDGVTPAYGGDYVQFSTYNTAANDNGFWLDDNDNWMEIKAKASLNVDGMTFSSEPNTPELYTDETVTVTNGMITKNSYTTTSNTTVDEISFEAEFSWDPGTVYKFVGHKRTGFLEDENPNY
ncbi:lipid-binding protein [Yeosuana marina]|uniref:lipid-binding protein n=1 Tax=Yeosuana marina TaxID=1565536 RepID=UPI0030EE1A82|tara:strand:+ start:6945 stop:7454 length:510 start_codon:yes stop_codon:yes gene_type:complete